MRTSTDLSAFVRPSPLGTPTIDFADPAAVLALNRALLKHHYGIARWDIPPGYLCPPVPGRADYVHHLADLLASKSGNIPRGPSTRILDLGVGANCVYPIIGVTEYGWSFVGTDIDPMSLASAEKIVANNAALAGRVECRLQRSPEKILEGVVKPHERFAAVMCNPPFHGSSEEAAQGTRRKLRNLGRAQRGAAPVLNFGGRNTELWCAGGELGFVQRLISESAARPDCCGWFTTLVSNRDSLPGIYRALKSARAHEVRTIDLAQGQKKTRIVAWHFR